MPYFYVLEVEAPFAMTCNPTIQKSPFAPDARGGHKVKRISTVRWWAVLWLFVGLLTVEGAWSQDDLLAVFGTVKKEDNNRKMEGVRVVVYQDGVEFDAIMTDSKGSYEFDLPLRHSYTFSFEYAEHSNKRIEVDASGIPMDVKGTRNMDLDMSLMPLPAGFDAAIFEDPYGRGEYSADQNTVIFDSNYTVRMRNKVNAELARLERMAGQEEEQRAKFDEFVEKGDRSKSGREWQKAVDFYDSALDLFPDEADVIKKRDEAQRELEAALADNSEIDEEYNELVEDGDIYFEREQWDRAIDKFAEASSLKPNEAYPKTRMEEAQTRQAELAAAQADLIAKTIEYEALIDEANLLFRDDNYAEALVKYEAAGEVLPAERFWQQRAEACRERMAEADSGDSGRRNREAEEAEREAAAALEREQRENYNRINDEADELFRNNDYAGAIEQYREASSLFPDERYPKQRIAEAEKRMARAEQAAADESRRADTADDDRNTDPARVDESELDAVDAAADAQRAAREAAEAAARSEAEQIEAEYDAAIAAADAAFDAQQWSQADRYYDEALALKPDDRYAKSRKDRVARAADAAQDDDDQRSGGPSQDELDRERAAMDREAAREAERQNAAAADLEAQLLADQAALREREEEERREQAERDRRRAEKLAQQLNNAGKDEVESYYQAALESEAAARKQQVEDQKQAQADLLRDAESRAEQRVERDLQDQKDLQRQGRAIDEAGLAQQEERRQEVADRVQSFEANAAQAREAGQEMIEQGASKVDSKRRWRNRLQSRRAQDYTLNVPEVEAKKRSFRNLFAGLSRAAEDRRSESRAQVEKMNRRFRRLGDGANARAQERWLEARRREKKEQQLLAQREQEARQRAYNEQQAAQANLREVGPLDPEDYKLSSGDEDIMQGVHEQSYDIPNGLVIERTVRTGNLVVRYRKVVTKTGVYYFRGDRSITADTWNRETTVVLD